MGRVNSVYRGASWGVIPIGAALGGFTADHLGLRAPFLLAAALLTVVAAAGLPHLRTARLAPGARRGGAGLNGPGGRPARVRGAGAPGSGSAGYSASRRLGATIR